MKPARIFLFTILYVSLTFLYTSCVREDTGDCIQYVYFSLAYPIIDALDNGKRLIIDEFDSKMHPLLTCRIITLFNSKETNPKNAQLIFTTHDTNLLSANIFRRDQIWFTQKDRYGATELYSLAEYKVRNDASFEKDYLSGKYGAIPIVGDLTRLFNTQEK